jgi:glucose/mannose-6-phosphate isomerase
MNMNDLVADFTNHLEKALLIGAGAQLNKHDKTISNIVITGLGGSGIGGTIVQELVSTTCNVPITVNKDYFLPAFVNENTLLIVCSYSGNTEETIQALEIGFSKNAKICCITSGGKIAAFAKTNHLDLIVIPGGMPPRACIAYSLVQLLFVLNLYGFTDNSFINAIKNSIKNLNEREAEIKKDAAKIAAVLHNKMPIIYCTAGNEGIAVRLRQQINENGKMLCWHHVIPEMNHNELVGWRKEDDNLSVLILRDTEDYSRTQTRIEICKEIISKYTQNITEVYSKGATKLEKTLYMIHIGDWISCYLAELKQIDPVEVQVIDYLKGSLAKS